MSTLDIRSNRAAPAAHKNRPRPGARGKPAIVYLFAALGCIVFNAVYSLFAHGVSSAAMYLLFLYPLLGGALPFGLLALCLPRAFLHRRWRLFCNLYHSGLALLILRSLLMGIFEIAGTGSALLVVYLAAGGLFCTAGLAGLLAIVTAAARQKMPKPG